jgi:hypothetical protein
MEEVRYYKLQTDSSENGSVLLELVIAIPLILFVSFTGFELARMALIRLVMSDIVREATTSSFLCSFRDESARANCFNEVISELQMIAASRYPPDPDNDLPGMLISLEAYEITQQTRSQICENEQQMLQVPLSELVMIVPDEIRQYKKYTLSGSSAEERTLGNLFPPSDPRSNDFMELACLNGSVFIAEVHLSYEPIVQVDFSSFFYGAAGNQGRTNWRSEFHAVVVL